MSSSAPPAPKSAVSLAAVAAAGTNCGSPTPPPSRLPRNWTLSAMISTACRFVPSCASHSRQSRRPSTPNGHVPHDAVRDLEDARDLVERLRVRVEREQVVDALALVVDLVGELPPPPDLLVGPGPAAALDELARARDDL